MTRHFAPLPPEATAPAAILVDAARCWRWARDSGEAIMPCLCETLTAHDCPILAPVFDSLIRFYESALGRPMIAGGNGALSDDERLLVGLIDGSSPRTCIGCPEGTAEMLDCALCSTRIMLTLTVQPAIKGLGRSLRLADPDGGVVQIQEIDVEKSTRSADALATRD
jgi:hypothetical protein